MAHISRIGRRTWGARLLLLGLYTLLALGGVTMVIPFMIWVSTSFTSEVDSRDYAVIPAFWRREDVLLRKYLQQQANYDPQFYRVMTQDPAMSFTEFALPAPAGARERADYYAYLRTLPAEYTLLSGVGPPVKPLQYGLQPGVQAYRAFCLQRYGSLEGINTAYGTAETNITRMLPPRESWWMRTFQPVRTRRLTEFLAFKQALPTAQLIPVPAEGIWGSFVQAKIGVDIAEINRTLGTRYTSLRAITFTPRVPAAAPALAARWEECVRNDMAAWYLRATPAARPAWTAFLARRYTGKIALYNRAHGTGARSFAAIPLPRTMVRDTVSVGEWNDFISHDAPITSLYLDSPEERYRAFLRRQYGTLAAVNAAYGTAYASWEAVAPPTARMWAAECRAHAGAIRWDFITRNYRTVFTYMALQGRAFFNTIVYVCLALLFTLTITPMAAYALSRFQLSFTNKILLFVLATMAFPAEISMIPNFLLLKELHLLNTFWALVLPGMANGFNIFLLKGMFDALPRDLYEAAELDGAGEAVMFTQITMPLVKPFLAYLSLNTFIAAYSAFAFAFVLCPDPKMWTIMVYLQQMSEWASQPVQFAGFVLASIPTLIVFITCQRVIMQGIVLPTEK